MPKLVADPRRIVNIALPIVILGDMVFYQFCLSSCSTLHGNLMGLDMKYLGLMIPIPLIVLAVLKLDLLYLLGLSFGIGGEITLVGFQIRHGVYCPYCLLAGAILLFLFLLNFDRSRKALMTAFIIIGFLFFQVFFHASVTPSYGKTTTKVFAAVLAVYSVLQKSLPIANPQMPVMIGDQFLQTGTLLCKTR